VERVDRDTAKGARRKKKPCPSSPTGSQKERETAVTRWGGRRRFHGGDYDKIKTKTRQVQKKKVNCFTERNPVSLTAPGKRKGGHAAAFSGRKDAVNGKKRKTTLNCHYNRAQAAAGSSTKERRAATGLPQRLIRQPRKKKKKNATSGRQASLLASLGAPKEGAIRTGRGEEISTGREKGGPSDPLRKKKHNACKRKGNVTKAQAGNHPFKPIGEESLFNAAAMTRGKKRSPPPRRGGFCVLLPWGKRKRAPRLPNRGGGRGPVSDSPNGRDQKIGVTQKIAKRRGVHGRGGHEKRRIAGMARSTRHG